MSNALGIHLPLPPLQQSTALHNPSQISPAVFMQSQQQSNFKPTPVANAFIHQPIDANTSQAFCLRWNNYQSNLTAIFEQLFHNEQFVDVTLCCEGSSIKAHKMVLSACSPYFQSLFNDNPCKHPIVILRDVKYSELKAVVEFMYRGEIDVCQDQITPLLQVAELLKVRGLADVSADQKIEVETAPMPPIKVQDVQVSDYVGTAPLVTRSSSTPIAHVAASSSPPPLTSAPPAVVPVIEHPSAVTETPITSVEYWNNNYAMDVAGRIESKSELKRKRTAEISDSLETPKKRPIKSEVPVVATSARAETFAEVIEMALDETTSQPQSTPAPVPRQSEDVHNSDLIIDEDKVSACTFDFIFSLHDSHSVPIEYVMTFNVPT